MQSRSPKHSERAFSLFMLIMKRGWWKCKETNLTNSGPFIQQFQHTHLQKEMGMGRRPRYDFGGN